MVDGTISEGYLLHCAISTSRRVGDSGVDFGLIGSSEYVLAFLICRIESNRIEMPNIEYL
jgi:hypothetical protein